MIAEAYLSFLHMVLNYGQFNAWLMISFLTSLPAFVGAIVGTLITRKIKSDNFIVKLILVEILFCAAWLFELFYYGVGGSLFVFIIPAAIIGILFVLPGSWAYSKIMKKYPKLPWHLMQWAVCFVACLALWAILIFGYGMFSLA